MKERTYQIVLDGIVITVTKKRIKNMYLRIKKRGRHGFDLCAVSDE